MATLKVYHRATKSKLSVGSPSSSSTLNLSSAISIADLPSNTNSTRFSANDPPSSHDPFNNLFSIDLFNSLLVLLAIPPSFSLRIRDILTLLLTSRSSVGLWSGLACQRAFDY
ncbi:hypothetical protein PGT21_016543 [Puccinia graminis f. sp. tritici]|uniref:Uncharacterized protein n=1 Tax=Puccinia graminis f. sp. tritici TaxID=56615 RepID=A0A5B0MXS4_PUCGR|nr:hypothetical protein PGT21_016543 [Puccinia graminis f. sp. tritici]